MVPSEFNLPRGSLRNPNGWALAKDPGEEFSRHQSVNYTDSGELFGGRDSLVYGAGDRGSILSYFTDSYAKGNIEESEKNIQGGAKGRCMMINPQRGSTKLLSKSKSHIFKLKRIKTFGHSPEGRVGSLFGSTLINIARATQKEDTPSFHTVNLGGALAKNSFARKIYNAPNSKRRRSVKDKNKTRIKQCKAMDKLTQMSLAEDDRIERF
jgi:hypothetical protein